MEIIKLGHLIEWELECPICLTIFKANRADFEVHHIKDVCGHISEQLTASCPCCGKTIPQMYGKRLIDGEEDNRKFYQYRDELE